MTKIDEQWVNFFRKNDIVPGVSIDGFGKTDNYLREKNKLLQQKIEYLRRNKIKHGSLMIITKNNIKSYYENILKMVDRFPDNMIKVNYAENTYTDKPADPEVSAEELYKYVFMPTLKYFFSKNIFIEENFRYTIDRFVKNIVFKEIEDRNYLCYANCLAKFCSGGNSVVEVDADGCVCFCGRWSDVNEVNVLGNYLDKNSDFFGLWSLNKILKLHVEKIADIRNKNCDSCDASDICTFGCIAFSYDKYHGKIKIREDLVCDYVKKIKTLLNKNKYQVIYHYVLSNGWEYKIINKEYYLNIPLLDTRYNYKDFLGNDIKWIQEDGNKFYFKVPAKLIEEKVSWQ
jgi:radical SAM protein with 4Fe4S-binding SPASM domain